MVQETEKEERKLNVIALSFFVAVLAIWLSSWLLIAHFIEEKANQGLFGDMFGAVNALFSGLAFVGVIYAILLQRQELKFQREELQMTRAELADQKQEMQTQNETLKQQRFENTFFQMVSLHNDIVSTVVVEQDITGREGLKRIFDRVRNKWVNSDKNLNAAAQLYKNYYTKHQNVLGHYFRNLYRIIKFIDESQIKDKKFYTDIIRAQLSNDELVLLFYNGALFSGGRKFKPYIEKYALLDNLNPEQLLSIDQLKLYAPSAYGAEGESESE